MDGQLPWVGLLGRAGLKLRDRSNIIKNADVESHSLQIYLPQSCFPTCLTVRLAPPSESLVVNFSEVLILVDPYIQVVEGLVVDEDSKGTMKVMFLAEMFLLMMVVEVPIFSRQYLSLKVTSSSSPTT